MKTKRTAMEKPYSVEKLKQHLRIYSEDENEYIEDLAESAISYIETYIGNNVIHWQTALTGSVKAGRKYHLKKFREIISVKSENETITDYIIENDAIIFQQDYSNAEIKYNETFCYIGYLQQCINLLVADWYENRTNLSQSENVGISSLKRLLGMYSVPVK